MPDKAIKQTKLTANTQINPTGNNAGWFSFFAGCASGLFNSLVRQAQLGASCRV
jgi:hypothetical protein